MIKCNTCGKEIKNAHYLDGKVYGINCYKIALAEKYKNYIDSKNLKYSLMVIACIEVYSNHKEVTAWGNGFKESILKQFNSCNKLTYKQLECCLKRMNKEENYKYKLLYINLLIENNIECNEEINSIKININSEMLEKFFNDELLHNILKNTKTIKGLNLVKYEYADEEDRELYGDIQHEILNNKKLDSLKNDDEIIIKQIINTL